MNDLNSAINKVQQNNAERLNKILKEHGGSNNTHKKEEPQKHTIHGRDFSLEPEKNIIKNSQKDNLEISNISKLNNKFDILTNKLDSIEKNENVYKKLLDFEKKYEAINRKINSWLDKYNFDTDKTLQEKISFLENKLDDLIIKLNLYEKINEFDKKIQYLNNKLE